MRHSFGAAALSVLFCLSLNTASGHAQEAKDTFKIGGLLALSGPLGVLGEDARRGMNLAIKVHGGKLLGAPISIDWSDTESKPQVAVQKATQLMSQGAEFLIGSVGSGETLAIMQVSSQRKVPLIVPLSTDPSITRENGNDYTYRTASSGDSLALAAAAYINVLDVTKVYGIASDYGVARAGWDMAKETFDEDIEVVGEDFPALGETDFSVIVNKIRSSGAQAVYVGTGGSDSIAFVRQAGEIGLQKEVTLVGPNLMDTTLAAGTGDAAIGVASALRYDAAIDTETNRAFVAAYQAEYGSTPSQLAGDSYDGMLWWLQVIDSTGVWDRQAWLAAFENNSWDGSVLGNRTMRACDNQSQHPTYIAVAEKGDSTAQPYIMEITRTFDAEVVATQCP